MDTQPPRTGHVGRTDRELLEVMLDRSERVEKALFGNGQPGMVTDVATLKEKVDDLDQRAPTRREKWAGWAVIAAALITAGSSIIVHR